MKIAVAKETREGESRVAMVPELVSKLTDLGYEVLVEPDAGDRAEYADELYVEAGATVADDALTQADVVLGVNALSSAARATVARRCGDAVVPAGQLLPRAGGRPARHRSLRLRDGARASHLARPVDGCAVLAVAGLGLPLRDRGGWTAAPLLPAEHDGCRDRATRAGGRARCGCRRPAGHCDLEAARGRRAGLRRPRRRRRGDPLDGSQVDRPGARDPRRLRWLRPRDDRGSRRAADGGARAVHRQRGCVDHHSRRARPSGAAARHRRDGRADEARIRRRGPRRRERRQRPGLGCRQGRPDRPRAGVGWGQRALADAGAGLQALRAEPRQPAHADDQRG